MDSITNSIDTSLSKFQKIVKDREAWRAVVHGVTSFFLIYAFIYLILGMACRIFTASSGSFIVACGLSSCGVQA